MKLQHLVQNTSMVESAERQGFGRLFRKHTDRCMVVALDWRLSKKGYGRMFLEALPACEVEYDDQE